MLPGRGLRLTVRLAAAAGLAGAAAAIIRGQVHDLDVDAARILVIVTIDLWFVLLAIGLFRGDGEAGTREMSQARRPPARTDVAS